MVSIWLHVKYILWKYETFHFVRQVSIRQKIICHLFCLLSTVSPQITQLDPGSTLLEAKLFPQETLFLEAKE